jgi:hypothetical protein
MFSVQESSSTGLQCNPVSLLKLISVHVERGHFGDSAPAHLKSSPISCQCNRHRCCLCFIVIHLEFSLLRSIEALVDSDTVDLGCVRSKFVHPGQKLTVALF